MLTTSAGNSRASLGGAPDSLLDTYEAERLPMAASVLGLSKKLFLKRSVRRGQRPTNSISTTVAVHWRPIRPPRPGRVRAGDRARMLKDRISQFSHASFSRRFAECTGRCYPSAERPDVALADFSWTVAPFIRVVRVLGQPENAGADISWTCMDTLRTITTCT